MDCLQDLFEDWVEELAGLLGIPVGE